MSTHKDNVYKESETRLLTHDEVDEQIMNDVVLLTKQLENLIRLTQ